jgi:5'-nucleotidase
MKSKPLLPLVIGVSSRALFDLEAENRVFKQHGLERYRQYQRAHEGDVLRPGPAFPLVSKLLRMNDVLGEHAVEVVIVSRNDADTSIRIFSSVQHYRLNIDKGAFTNGAPNYAYLKGFGASLYLSAHLEDVRNILSAGCAAAHVMGTPSEKGNATDDELRIGFDFDGVLADDESERIFQAKQLKAFLRYEERRQGSSMEPGPIQKFLKLVGMLRRRAGQKGKANIRTAIFTARGSPAHDRVVATLRKNGLIIDETFFLGGLKKAAFVEAFRADIFFDDQLKHLSQIKNVVTAFVPFGLVNARGP